MATEQACHDVAAGDRHARTAGWVAWLVGLAAASAFGVYLVGHPPWVRYSADARLDRAAQAVVQVRRRRGLVVVRTKGDAIAVPAALQFDRERAVRLALELDDMLRDGGSVALPVRVRADPRGRRQAAQLEAEMLLGEFLAVEPERARLVLCALGWPAPEGASSDAAGASRLSGARAMACREAVVGAFASEQGYKDACEGLARSADLAPAQCETVLAMAGALELTRAGRAGVDALRIMAKTDPRLGQPLLRYASGRLGSAPSALR